MQPAHAIGAYVAVICFTEKINHFKGFAPEIKHAWIDQDD